MHTQQPDISNSRVMLVHIIMKFLHIFHGCTPHYWGLDTATHQRQATYHIANVQGGTILRFSPSKLPRHEHQTTNWWNIIPYHRHLCLASVPIFIDDHLALINWINWWLAIAIIDDCWLISHCSWLDSSIKIACVMLRKPLITDKHLQTSGQIIIIH